MKTETIFVVACPVTPCVDAVVDACVTDFVVAISRGVVFVFKSSLVMGCSPANPSDTMSGVLLLSVWGFVVATSVVRIIVLFDVVDTMSSVEPVVDFLCATVKLSSLLAVVETRVDGVNKVVAWSSTASTEGCDDARCCVVCGGDVFVMLVSNMSFVV